MADAAVQNKDFIERLETLRSTLSGDRLNELDRLIGILKNPVIGDGSLYDFGDFVVSSNQYKSVINFAAQNGIQLPSSIFMAESFKYNGKDYEVPRPPLNKEKYGNYEFYLYNFYKKQGFVPTITNGIREKYPHEFIEWKDGKACGLIPTSSDLTSAPREITRVEQYYDGYVKHQQNKAKQATQVAPSNADDHTRVTFVREAPLTMKDRIKKSRPFLNGLAKVCFGVSGIGIVSLIGVTAGFPALASTLAVAGISILGFATLKGIINRVGNGITAVQDSRKQALGDKQYAIYRKDLKGSYGREFLENAFPNLFKYDRGEEIAEKKATIEKYINDLLIRSTIETDPAKKAKIDDEIVTLRNDIKYLDSSYKRILEQQKQAALKAKEALSIKEHIGGGKHR